MRTWEDKLAHLEIIYRKKYEGKYSRRVPAALFKGNYGQLRGGQEDKRLLTDITGINHEEEEDPVSTVSSVKPPQDSKAGDLFKKKGLAIGKLAAMNFVSSKDKARMKEERDKNEEEFRKKREQIKKEKENKKILLMNKLEEELLNSQDGNEAKKKKKRDMDELSVSSGEGEVFIHNLMGFWT